MPDVPLSSDELDLFATQLVVAHGYPATRLFLSHPDVRLDGTTLWIPPGPWHITDHHNRRDAPAALSDPDVPGPDGEQVDPALTARWRAAGLLVDQHGRPIHPDWRLLLAHPRIGLPTGLGFFWRWGPNATADALVIRRTHGRPEVLLVRRRDLDKWALPGGFVDRTDACAQDAAVRELAEETGLGIPQPRTEVLLARRSPNSIMTLHAWTENTVVLVDGDPDYLADAPLTPAAAEVSDVAWTDLATARTMDMFDRHASYLALVAED
ncbi:NUDIX hydrolase [Actinospica durhamensis]|uniref:NUDIX hydrolase n=1 Tax=Actinospica durhamensis TaxID=1508375 RepID=A0A941EMR7_9ACTN|nr:NUDIX hydrolase [Actinospica durhamensis]MBR7833875.1 NUDIX hydrolase [Actinospica durhamensis]